MEPSPLTRASLLVRIRDGQDREAWGQFVQLYAPLVYGFVRKRGLQDADAADLMQDVLRSVAGAANRLDYDPKRGTFRSWLYTVTRNKLYSFLDGQRRQVRGTGDTGTHERLDKEPAPDADDLWEKEYQQNLFNWACDQVKSEFQANTWQAFWETAVDGRNPREVAGRLGLSPGAVYVAKSRVLARIRDCVQDIEED